MFTSIKVEKKDNVVELASGGSVINKATPSTSVYCTLHTWYCDTS